jgi:hypothetical protein
MQFGCRPRWIARRKKRKGEVVMSFPILGVEAERNLERGYRAIYSSSGGEECAESVVGPGGGMIFHRFEKHRDLFGATWGGEALLGQRS